MTLEKQRFKMVLVIGLKTLTNLAMVILGMFIMVMDKHTAIS